MNTKERRGTRGRSVGCGGTTITNGMVFMVPIDAVPYLLRYVGEQERKAFFRIK